MLLIHEHMMRLLENVCVVGEASGDNAFSRNIAVSCLAAPAHSARWRTTRMEHVEAYIEYRNIVGNADNG